MSGPIDFLRFPASRCSSRSPAKCSSSALRNDTIAAPCRVFCDIGFPSDSGYSISSTGAAAARCSAMRSSAMTTPGTRRLRNAKL